jgi:hypothetical protein
VRGFIFAVVAGVLTGAWVLLSVRRWRRDPNWSLRRDLVALGISAAVTIFIVLPIEPNHPEHARSAGSQIALWIPLWLLLATAIRVLMLLRRKRGG